MGRTAPLRVDRPSDAEPHQTILLERGRRTRVKPLQKPGAELHVLELQADRAMEGSHLRLVAWQSKPGLSLVRTAKLVGHTAQLEIIGDHTAGMELVGEKLKKRLE